MSKNNPLVTQCLEKIPREALQEYQDVVRQYVKGRQDVYALYRGEKLYYVGLAGNLRNRLKHHLRDRHSQSWNRFSVYLTIGDRHLKELESLILRIVKPSGNKQRGKFVKAEDLRRRFRQAIREAHRRTEDCIVGRTLAEPSATSTGRRRGLQQQTGRRPALAMYKDRPKTLKATFKGKVVKAYVRKDGSITCAGKVFLSPSMAAAAACRRRTCNGWIFWNFERSPGDWVTLAELRK